MALKTATRRSPTGIIEGSPKGSERAYFKVPLREPIDITLNPTMDGVYVDTGRIKDLLVASKRSTYSSIHTHPVVYLVPKPTDRCLPSGQDIFTFMCHSDEKVMIIAARGLGGTVYAYSITRKTRETPKPESQADKERLRAWFENSGIGDSQTERILERYYLQYRTLDRKLLRA
ncbi:MAG: hypothetical protein KGH94_04245 [Candidatus Micrarchaeota archaeon]|nr:hypothetical protein [Candidatus Micrarchaeota archaeon]